MSKKNNNTNNEPEKELLSDENITATEKTLNEEDASFVEELLNDGDETSPETVSADNESDDGLEAFLGDLDNEADANISVENNNSKNKKRTRADTRRFRYGGIAMAVTAAAVALVVLINILASTIYKRFPITFDITADNLYTMTDESKEIAKNITKDVKITIFYDEKAITEPEKYNYPDENLVVVLKQLGEFLKQYRLITNDKVTYEFLDFDSNPLLTQQYPDNAAGDILFRCTFVDEDGEEKTRSEKAVLTDLFTSSSDGYNSYVNSSEVDRVMSSNLLRVTSDSAPVVVLLTGYEEDESTIAGVERMFGNSIYSVVKHNISGSESMPEDAVLAVIPAPLKDYDEGALDRLEKWVENDSNYNHHLVLIANSGGTCPNLYKKIRVEYDIEVTSNIVVETDYNNLFSMYSPYYSYGEVVDNSDVAGDSAGKRSAFPLSLQLLTTRVIDENSSKQGADLVTFPESAKLYSLAALEAAEKDGTEPEPVDSDKYPIVGMAYAYNYGYKDGTDLWETKVLVSGSSMFFDNSLAQQVSAASVNEKLFLTLMDSFTGNEVPITVQSHYFDTSILEFSATHANIMFFIFILAVPLGLIICGVIIFVRRRRL